jgi:hypothetical protein
MKQKTLCFVAAALAVVVGSVVVLGSRAAAQDSQSEETLGSPARRAVAGVAAPALSNHTLTGTFFDVNAAGATAACGSAFCSATPVNLFLEHIKCPGATGTKCVFQITITSQNQTGSNDLPANPSEEGLYQFLVDGTPPSPGPTLVGGFYLWTLLQAASSISAVSTAVTGSVTNSAANQVHSISVAISCNEVSGDSTGCFESTQFANLQIARYHP